MVEPDFSTSPYPEGNLDFTILWCRMMNCSVSTWTCQMRDCPMKMLEVEDMHVWGRLIAAEQEGVARGLCVHALPVPQSFESLFVQLGT